MMTKQSFKCLRSLIVILHSPSNAVIKLQICYLRRHSLLVNHGNILETPWYELHIRAIKPHSMSSVWQKIWYSCVCCPVIGGQNGILIQFKGTIHIYNAIEQCLKSENIWQQNVLLKQKVMFISCKISFKRDEGLIDRHADTVFKALMCMVLDMLEILLAIYATSGGASHHSLHELSILDQIVL